MFRRVSWASEPLENILSASESDEVPLTAVQRDGGIWYSLGEQMAPFLWDQGVRVALVDANRRRYILWREAPRSGDCEILVDDTPGIVCAFSHDYGKPWPQFANRFGFMARLSAHRDSQKCSPSVLRNDPNARADATKHYRCSASKTGEGTIEVIELLESCRIIEGQTSGNDCATGNSFPELIRGGQSVLTTF